MTSKDLSTLRWFCACHKLATQRRPRDCRDKGGERSEALTLPVTITDVVLFQFVAPELLKVEPFSCGRKAQDSKTTAAVAN